MIEYYSRRAREYERIYHKPERQEDLAKLRDRIGRYFTGADVLEIACGTGYWTEVIAPHARTILATDVSPEVLEIARNKRYRSDRVRFAIANALDPGTITGEFSGGFGGFCGPTSDGSSLPVSSMASTRDSLATPGSCGWTIVMWKGAARPSCAPMLTATPTSGARWRMAAYMKY